MKRTYLLFSIVVALLCCLQPPGSERQRLLPPHLPSPGVATPPRECTINVWTDGTKNIKIEAGPGLSGLADQFPISTFCPGTQNPCLQWQYRWTFTNVTPIEALVSVDSDITVLSSIDSQCPGF